MQCLVTDNGSDLNKSVQMPWMEFLTLSRSDPARSNLVFRPDQFKSGRKTRLMPNGFFISFKGYPNDFQAHLSKLCPYQNNHSHHLEWTDKFLSTVDPFVDKYTSENNNNQYI